MKITHPSPLIGIMTAKKSNGVISGNGPLFIALQKKLISLNGISFVFIPEDIEEDFIIGYTFSPEHNRWKKECFPYPDLVYNRIPFRKAEKNEHCQRFFSTLKKKNIPFFNPSFIDKYELFTILSHHEFLKKFLPQTILIQDKSGLLSFLKKFIRLYLKPTQSSKGKGIVRITLTNHSQVKLEGMTIQESYPSFCQFWQQWGSELLEKHYLAQEEIQSAVYKGNRFDFRILAHADHDDYIVTGVGIRQSQKQGITTHIPAGGRLLPYQLVQSSEHDEFIQSIVPHVGKVLSDQLGFFGEFSIDAGVSNSGKYYIYEVNSKPMSFDEADIENKKIDHLCKLFQQLVNIQK